LLRTRQCITNKKNNRDKKKGKKFLEVHSRLKQEKQNDADRDEGSVFDKTSRDGLARIMEEGSRNIQPPTIRFSPATPPCTNPTNTHTQG